MAMVTSRMFASIHPGARLARDEWERRSLGKHPNPGSGLAYVSPGWNLAGKPGGTCQHRARTSEPESASPSRRRTAGDQSGLAFRKQSEQ